MFKRTMKESFSILTAFYTFLILHHIFTTFFNNNLNLRIIQFNVM